jgi:hypothetical protein
MLVRLLYASRPVKALTPEDIESILHQSRAHNPELGITGILCWSGSTFLQVLEGGRDAVNRIYNTIVADPRHKDVALLQYEEVTERCFGHWTMGQVNLTKINPSMLLKYSERPALDPYALPGRVSMALLQELIATAAIIGRAG